MNNSNKVLLKHRISIQEADDSRISKQPLQETMLTIGGSERLRNMSPEFKDLSTLNEMAKSRWVSSTTHPLHQKHHEEWTSKGEVYSNQHNTVLSQAEKKMTTTRNTEISQSNNVPSTMTDPPMSTEPTTTKQLPKESTLSIRHESTTILSYTTTVSPRYSINTAGCKIPNIDP